METKNSSFTPSPFGVKVFEKNTQSVLNLTSGLAGIYQIKNILGVITLINLLAENHFKITLENIENGLENVIKNTNLKGRWQKIGENPLIICDTGHNEHALKLTFKKINELNFPNKHIILGFVKDKIIDEEIALLPKDYNYYLTSFGSQSAMKEAELNRFSEKHQLNAKIFNNVNEAISSAITNSTEKDFIFVGGSTYLIAEINSL
jgi:dihydrofolate synthase/folylpolyglutamate synthase